MERGRAYAVSVVTLGLLSLAHALWTWPRQATLALFGGGALVAFVAEAVVVQLGWLDHHVGPKLLGVPLYVLFGWTGVVYVSFRVALLVTPGWAAVALAAVLATALDVLSDPRGVAEGHWTYTDDLPGPRHRDVPWWNYAGWLAVSASTAALALQYLP
ncbi:carotenoid biosynthesis protein [Halobacterium zhouii]|uniref:carotenoid biosynthesis protein n=1 Tax=Halobacterium zhouii TaxID=2902624 RepID=UPI001E2B38D1|nr:carotenoid biosynthesis protein [Halobacterium zhouii]